MISSLKAADFDVYTYVSMVQRYVKSDAQCIRIFWVKCDMFFHYSDIDSDVWFTKLLQFEYILKWFPYLSIILPFLSDVA